MMINYPGLTKLKTKPIVYENVLLASDPGTLEQIKELTSTRKAVEDSINENNHVTEAIAREMSGGLTSRSEQDILKLEQYLPLLENLISHISKKAENHRMLRWISDLKIRWSSVFISSSVFQLKCVKFHQVDDIYFELGSTLFLYGAMLRERALEVVSSDLVEAATLFRKAAGVFDYLAKEVVVRLIRYKERTPETTPQMASVMCLVCLADAQAVTARKAEEKGSSGSLLAKLHSGIALFLVEAIDILQATMKKSNDVSSRVLDYICNCKTLHNLKSYKYTAEGLEKDGKIGMAIGVVRVALSKKNGMPKDECWRSVFRQVTDDLTALLRKYEHENEFVWYDKIPCNDDLPSSQGVKIVNLIPYQPQKLEKSFDFKWVNS